MQQNEFHREILLRPLKAQPLKVIHLDDEFFIQSTLNLNESTAQNEHNTLERNILLFKQLNIEFNSLYLKMKRRMMKCIAIHAYYMEIHHNLMLIPTINMRTLRHYVIDHLVILIQTFMQVSFLGDGHIVRSEDSIETSSNRIHPSISKALTFEDGENQRRVQLSLTSVRALFALRTDLLDEIQRTTSSPDILSNTVKHFDPHMASIGENIRNWLTDSLNMIEMLQERIQVRLCVGYTFSNCGESYNLTFVQQDQSSGGLHISAVSIASRLHLNFRLINYNIEHCIIAESVGCSIGRDVKAMVDYRLFVEHLIENKIVLYETYERTKYMTNISLAIEISKQKIQEAEENVDVNEMYWVVDENGCLCN